MTERTPATPAPWPNVVADRGVSILGTVLWLDTPRLARLAFASRAGLPHVPLRPSTVCTPETTRRTAAMRGPRAHRSPLQCPPGRVFSVGPLHLSLHPSGYCPGSAQLGVDVRGARIVYAGDIGLAPQPKDLACVPLPSDVWIGRWAREAGGLDLESAGEALRSWTAEALGRTGFALWLVDALADAERAWRWSVDLAAHVVAPAGIRRVLSPLAPGLEGTASSRGKDHIPMLVLWPDRQPLPRAWADPVRHPRAHLVAEERGTPLAANAWPLVYRVLPRREELAIWLERQRPKVVYLHGPGDADSATWLRTQGFDARGLSQEQQLSLSM